MRKVEKIFVAGLALATVVMMVIVYIPKSASASTYTQIHENFEGDLNWTYTESDSDANKSGAQDDSWYVDGTHSYKFSSVGTTGSTVDWSKLSRTFSDFENITFNVKLDFNWSGDSARLLVDDTVIWEKTNITSLWENLVTIDNHYTGSHTLSFELTCTTVDQGYSMYMWFDNLTLYAESVPPTHTLTMQSQTGGTTTPTSGDHTYDENTVVNISAIPDGTHHFTGWMLDGSFYSSNTSTNVTMDTDHTALANFALNASGYPIDLNYPEKGVNSLHTGFAPVQYEPTLTLLWHRKILGAFDEFSVPIVVGDNVYSANKGDYIFRCLDLYTGYTKWSYQLNSPADGSPLWWDNKIYIGTGMSSSYYPHPEALANFYCFAENGTLLWEYDSGLYGISSTPWINPDNRYVYWEVAGNPSVGYLITFNADNGSIIRSDYIGSHDATNSGTGAYYNGITYAVSSSILGWGGVRAYNASSGSLLWTAGANIWDSGVTVDNENADNVVIYFGSCSPATIWCVDAENGQVYWDKKLGDDPYNLSYCLTIPTLWENKVYVGRDVVGSDPTNLTLCVFEDKTGDNIWHLAVGSVFTSVTILPSGTMILAPQNGYIEMRNAENGDLLDSYYIGNSYCSAVAVVDNHILVSSDAGYVWCFGVGTIYPSCTATDQRTENQINPDNLTTNTPTLSWTYDDVNEDPQTQRQIQVGASENTSDMWNSTVSTSSASAVYAGSTLTIEVTYHWRVRVDDGYGWSSWLYGGTFSILGSWGAIETWTGTVSAPIPTTTTTTTTIGVWPIGGIGGATTTTTTTPAPTTTTTTPPAQITPEEALVVFVVVVSFAVVLAIKW